MVGALGQFFRMCFAILGWRPVSSVKWWIRVFSISFRVFLVDSVSSLRFARHAAAFGFSLILSWNTCSQSRQIRPLAELLK